MTIERPELRQISARLLTQAGWMIGTFHVPVASSFLDHLNHAGAFFKLTNVTIGSTNDPVEFFALRRAEVTLVIPESSEDELKLGDSGENTKSVSCWLPTGEVVGSLQLQPGVRVSDHLLHHEGFTTLRDCVGRDLHAAVNAATVVFVNAGRVLGVVDRPDDAF